MATPTKRNDAPSSSDLLQDEETVGDMPGSSMVPSIAESPGTKIQIKARGSQEYVSGSSNQWYTNFARSLPWAIDDVSRDFGSDIYERMMLDPQVKSSINVAKSMVLDEGLNLAPAVELKEDDGFEQAKNLTDDAEEMIDNLTTGMDDVLWDLLESIGLGNRAAEMTFQLDTTIGGREQYLLDTLAVKPRDSYAFVVNAYYRVIGILGRVPGMPFPVQQGTLLADIDHAANLLPRSKFAVSTFRPTNNDPRGTSVLRACFDPWQQKTALRKEFLKYLTQFATPSVIGNTAENAETFVLTEPDGVTPLTNDKGEPLIQTPEEALLQSLMGLSNGTAIALPYGVEVTPLMMSGEGEAFHRAFQGYNQEITKVILNQMLATEESQHQTRAATGAHKDVLDTVIRQMKRFVERMITKDILTVWVRLNHGRTMDALIPKAKLGVAEQEDLGSLWTGASQLKSSGYLDDSQLPELDRELRLPERTIPTPEELAAERAHELALAQANAPLALPPPDQKIPNGASPASPAPPASPKAKAPAQATPPPGKKAAFSAKSAIKEAAKRPPSGDDIQAGRDLLEGAFAKIMDRLDES